MSKEKILNLLRLSHTGFLSGEELGRKTGISRTMVWKHIKSLENEGFGVEAVPSQGYRITSEPDVLRKSDVRQALKTGLIGREFRLLPEVASTNTLAMEMASNGAPEGTVIIAETQTGGKGRLGRTWISPKGNVYLSVILRPNIPVQNAPLITLMGAVAVAAAVTAAAKVSAAIKWPNDIYVSGKKVSGLLTEMSAEQDRIKHIVLGIGVDVNMDLAALPVELRALTTTLALEAGKRIDRTELVRRLCMDLERWYGAFLKDPSDVLREWEKFNMTTGNRVAVRGLGETFEGLAKGIDSEGRLLVELGDGTIRRVAAGDVTILKR
jgi:BirA family biotin operon repressor/biotin-[acetyl-CoA-carboxylase] ligase